MTNWRRPPHVPYPSVWHRFEGKQQINDGPRRKYWVQDLTDEYKEQVLDLMVKYFIRDEAMCKYSNMQNDLVAVKELRDLWAQKCDAYKLGLVCLTEGDDGKPEIVGANMTYWAYTAAFVESLDHYKSPTLKKWFEVTAYITNKVDVAKELNITEHLSALGLLVVPKFRGEGIGINILKSRRELCKAVGLKASITLFSSNTSQAVPKRRDSGISWKFPTTNWQRPIQIGIFLVLKPWQTRKDICTLNIENYICV